MNEATAYKWAAQCIRCVGEHLAPHHQQRLADVIASALVEATHPSEPPEPIVDVFAGIIDFHDGAPIEYWWEDVRARKVRDAVVEAFNRGRRSFASEAETRMPSCAPDRAIAQAARRFIATRDPATSTEAYADAYLELLRAVEGK